MEEEMHAYRILTINLRVREHLGNLRVDGAQY
jgi:hypothetical protein